MLAPTRILSLFLLIIVGSWTASGEGEQKIDRVSEHIKNNLNHSVKPCDNFYRHVCPLAGKDMGTPILRMRNLQKDVITALTERWTEIDGLQKKHEQMLEDLSKKCDVEDTFKYAAGIPDPAIRTIAFIKFVANQSTIIQGVLNAYSENLEKIYKFSTPTEIANNFASAKILNEPLISEIAATIRNSTLAQQMHGKHSMADLLSLLMEMQRTDAMAEEGDLVYNVTAVKAIQAEFSATPGARLTPQLSFGSTEVDRMFEEASTTCEILTRYMDTSFETLLNQGSLLMMGGPANAASIRKEYDWFNRVELTPFLLHDILHSYTERASKSIYNFVVGHELFHQFFLLWFPVTMKDTFLSHKACIEKSAQETCELFAEKQCSSGPLTFSEDAPDLEGMRIAYKLFSKEATNDGAQKESEEERRQFFFYTEAYYWCRDYENAQHREMNEHSALYARINGVYRKMPEFAAAFNCKAGDPMVAEETCELFQTAQ